MAEEKTEKLPIDAKLLTDAVIELNISRRSVGLYPREHPIVRESIGRAHDFMIRLFEIRDSITLGIARDVLMIDHYILDRKNPVFREFAHSLYRKGIIAVTFSAGLGIEELTGFHEMLLAGDEVIGDAVLKLAEEKGLRHIRPVPMELSKLKFTENGERRDGSDLDIWGNYITALLEGRLAEADAEGIALHLPPEELALYLNERGADAASGRETYDRVITTYLKRQDYHGVKAELFHRFISVIGGLSPEIKQQLLKRAFDNPYLGKTDMDHLVRGLSSDDIEKLLGMFRENASLIPESLQNIIDKISSADASADPFFELLPGNRAMVDDIEIDERVVNLFRVDSATEFVGEEYRNDLSHMLKTPAAGREGGAGVIAHDCADGIIGRKYSDLLVELLEAEEATRQDYLDLLTKLVEVVRDFMDTGRFSEISDVYNIVYSHGLSGRYREEASGMLDYYFHSGLFIDGFLEALKVWGRHDREGVQRLVRVQRRYLADPLIGLLVEEEEPSNRKFLLQVLGGLGSEIVPGAVVRLGDNRWYVVRNMICLIREAGSEKDAHHVRRFAESGNKKICIEAIRTLIYFKTPDAILYVKKYLEGDDQEMRDYVVRFAGIHRFRAIVPTLLKLLMRNRIFGRQTEFRKAIIRALGEIGDPSAVKSLETLVRSSAVINRAAAEELKVEIYRSLGNYPPGAAAALLQMGLESGNSEIRSLSAGVLRG
ncbi:MAG: HEAT repeat domain-containing protein [Nitrospiraceae bacterium]|nr:HEAT repeat domain-containing protein [Nitrospiraceae bacterium]